jgi:mRNA interferase MazF
MSEPIGRRAVVLVSREEAYEVRKSVAVVEVSTVVRSLATEVRLGPEDGVPRSSVANADAINTIARRRLTERICMLRAERIAQIDKALRFALALD